MPPSRAPVPSGTIWRGKLPTRKPFKRTPSHYGRRPGGTIEGLAPQVAALEQARFVASQEGPGLRVAAPAVAPETPVGPNRYIVVAGAALLGAILGMIVYFALLTLRVYARELDRS